MIKVESKNKQFMKLVIYLYTFFIFYMPRISDLFLGIKIEVFSLVLLFFMVIPWIILSKNRNTIFKFNRKLFLLIVGIFISAIYFAIRASIGSYDIRVAQNLFIIIQIAHILIIFDFMKYIGFQKDDMLRVLFNLAFIQAIITILMLLFPSLKTIALSLYYLNGEENIFISRMRIYGISGDYTFFTPIYHGILASIAFYYSIFKSRKYLIYLPFLFLIILLNGRFGLIVFAMSLIILLLHFLFRGKISFKMIRISILTLLILISGTLALSVISPYTYNWIIGGIEDTINLLLYNEKSGNYIALAGTHLSFPQGMGVIMGEGYRLFGGQAIERGYHASDIGYVNDIFMGGLIYISILYGSILIFILKKPLVSHFKNKEDFNLYLIISKFLVVALLVANYKGEVMRGGTVVLSTIFIILILSYNSKKEKM